MVLGAASVVALWAGPALAHAVPIHVPAQSLSRSLNDVARQSGTSILFVSDVIGEMGAPALDGSMNAKEAVERLIAGSALEVVSGEGGLIVRRKAQPSAPTPRPEPAPMLAPLESFVGESVTVTGIRHSLQMGLNIKRDALGLVDVITSETIGKFPDSNIATAIMRIPGVNVNRRIVGMSGIDSTMGEPTEVTVRGFGPTFNVVLIDGRTIGSSVGSRSFDFSLLSGDMVQRIDVHKSPDASLVPGAIGATIDIINPKPFDATGLRVAASVSTTYSPNEGPFTPNGMVLFSDTFAGDKLGLLVAASYAETRSRSNEATVWGWEGTYLDRCQFAGGPACGASLNPDTSRPVWFIQDYGVYQIHNWAMRENARAALQYRPLESLLVTLNANFARNDLKERQYDVAIWNNASEMRNVETSRNGTVVNFTRAGTPTDFGSQSSETVQQTYDLGLNARWEVNSAWTVEVDGDMALSSMNPGSHQGNYGSNVGYGPSCNTGCLVEPTNGNNVGFAVAPNGGHVLPYYTVYGPDGVNDHFLDSDIIGSHVMVISLPRNRNTVNQAKLEMRWASDDTQVTFGFQYLANHMRLALYDNFGNNQWQAFAGYGPDSKNYYVDGPNAGLPAGVHLPSSLFTRSFSTRNFISGWNEASLPPRIMAYDVFAVFGYLEGLGDPATPTAVPGFNWGCCDPAYRGKFETVINPAAYQTIFEDNYAGYVTVTGDTELAGISLTYHAGLRLESTGLYSTGMEQLPTALTVMPSDHTAFLTSYGPLHAVAANHGYHYLLPNVDLTLHLSEDFLLRLNASRTLSRPPLTSISPTTTLSTSERVGSLVAVGQNPSLTPYISHNVDATAEWYYAANSYISADAFYKNVADFVIANTVTRSINNVVDPTTGQLAQFRVSSYINGPSADVYGLELALQHMIEGTGFGFQVNATIVTTDRPYDPYDISTSNFAVTGLADSANLVAFYDCEGFEIRFSANWHDSFLERFGHMQPNSAFGAEPVVVNPSWDTTFNLRWDVTADATVYFEVLNLLNSTYSTRARFPEQVLDVVDYGRRFTLGLHYKL